MAHRIQVENPVLAYGDFIGTLCREVVLREFILKEVLDRTDEEVPRHTHEDAHFLLIVEGLYMTSARDIDHFCSSSTLIFNPAGTTHDDRFHTRGGRFFTVSLKHESLGCFQKEPISTLPESIRCSSSSTAARLMRSIRRSPRAICHIPPSCSPRKARSSFAPTIAARGVTVESFARC